MNDDVYITKDKLEIPYLLTQTEKVKLKGHFTEYGIVFFKFSPKELAEELAVNLKLGTAPPVDPKMLFNALAHFRDVIFEEKRITNMNNGANYGTHTNTK